MSSQASEESGQLVALADAAEMLGVHYMTAYRYVRTGRMYAIKRGGKWWVESSAIEAIRNEGTGARRANPDDPRTLQVEPFSARLLAGDAGGCWDLITDALRSGAAPAEVHRRLLHPALVQVGEQWASGEITIAAEHRATATANRLIGQMGPMFRHPGRRRGTVVIGTVSGDPHTLPSAMLTDLLADRHLDVVDLGANTPADSFIETARATDGLVGIGVCAILERRVDTAVEIVTAIRQAFPTMFILAGGAAPAGSPERFAGIADQVTVSGDEASEAFEAVATGAAASNSALHGTSDDGGET